MRIVVLIENTSASEKLKVEHGLSFYIEHAGKSCLIDTGASDKIVANAKRMRIPLEKVSRILISHNHFSHTGGIEAVLKLNPEVEIYAKAACADEAYAKYGVISTPIGQLGFISEEYPNNFILYNKFQEIDDGFFAMSNEYPDYSMYCEDRRLYIKSGGKLIRDAFAHEAFFVIFPDARAREKGCVVISPCSHCGIVNILRTVNIRFPDSPILSVIGGFHMMGTSTKKLCCSPDLVDKTANELMGINTGAIYTCHCTGLAGYGMLKSRLGDRIQYLQTGEELVF